MRQLRLVLALLVALALSGLGPAGVAGPPGKWSVLSGGPVSLIYESGTYRTADGVLHVAMVRDNGSSESVDIAHVSETGQLLGRSVAVEGWASITDDPELVGVPGGGMRLVFTGLRSTDITDPYASGYIWQATSDAAGAAWTLLAQPALADTSGYASYGTSATTLPDGTPVTAYPLNSDFYYQVGAGAVQSFTFPDCCVYDIGLATEGGNVWAAWYANGDAAAHRGTFVRQIYPVLGPILQAPGSVVSSSGSPGSLGTDQGVAIVARAGGGVYVAYLTGYPTAKAVALWRIGSSGFKKVPSSKAADGVAMSSAGSGRLWIAFDVGDRMRAVRTGTNGTTFGAVQDLRAPKKSDSLYRFAVEGSHGRADVVVNDGTSFWHQQVNPGLSLTAKPGKWNGNAAKKVTFKVKDADDAIKGAKVKAAGKSCTTSKKGTCDIAFPARKPGKVGAVAKKSGYAPDNLKLTVT